MKIILLVFIMFLVSIISILLNYIELFEMEPDDVEKGILKLREKFDNDFVYIIGNDMRYLDEIMDEELEGEYFSAI